MCNRLADGTKKHRAQQIENNMLITMKVWKRKTLNPVSANSCTIGSSAVHSSPTAPGRIKPLICLDLRVLSQEDQTAAGSSQKPNIHMRLHQ